ncbi:MAG: PKD domain-containing protein [Flavobacteriales bacterium]|nr:MAG: PKD domain-containing protein [Flavobacteriales bacterium]
MKNKKRFSLFLAIFLLLVGITYAEELLFHKELTVVKEPVKKARAAVIAKRCLAGNVVELYTSEVGPYQWYDDNGVIANADANTFRPTATGTYKLKIGDDFSNTLNLTFNVPTAIFSHNATNNACGTETVSFTNNSTNGESYLWDFGDGQFSTDQNPTHTYTASLGSSTQEFKVKLTVTNSVCQSVTSNEQVVFVKQLPDISISGNFQSTVFDGKNTIYICSDTDSEFEIDNISSTRNTNASYKIIWGDGAPDYVSNTFTSLRHIYPVGIKTMKIITTGQNGCVSEEDFTVFVGQRPAGNLDRDQYTDICSGGFLTFKLSEETKKNPPGTIYRIKFNDNTPEIKLVEPLADSQRTFNKTFDKSSCGFNFNIGGQNISNSFGATFIAENPCNSSTGAIGNIFVNDKPKASFNKSKSNIVCEEEIITFTNTGTANTAKSTGCTSGKFVWSIEGANVSDYTIVSGSMGEVVSASSWITGTSPLTIKFVKAGKYKIKIRIRGEANINGCGEDSYEEEICVNPKPIASFTLPTSATCAPYALRPTNTSNSPLPNCGNNTYTWRLTKTGSTTDCDNFNSSAVQTSSQESPTFNLLQPGVYSLTLTTSNASGTGCTVTSAPQTITIKAPPTAVISNTIPATICEGASINPTTIVKNCWGTDPVSYEWEFPGASTTSSTLANPTNITYPTKGNYQIRLKVTNECGPSTVYTRNITINEKPILNTITNIVACNGGPVSATNFSTSTSGATTYTWTNTNTAIGLAASGNGNLPAFTARNTGTTPIVATITVTPRTNGSTGCTGEAKTFTITVNPAVAAANAGANLSECNVTSTRLSATAAPNGGVWSVVSGTTPLTFDDPTNPTATVSGLVNGGNYLLKWTVRGYAPCGDSESTITITVAPETVAGTTSGAATYCGTAAAGAVTLSGYVGTILYWEQSTNGTNWNAIPLANHTPTLNYVNLTTTTYYRAVVKSGSCSMLYSSPTKIELVAKPAAPLATTNYTYCLNDASTVLTATGTDLKWYAALPLNSTNLLAEAPTPPTSTATTLTYYVTQSVGGCESNYTAISVKINPIINNNVVSADRTICLNGTPSSLAGQLPTGGSGTYTYQWEVSTDNSNFSPITGATNANYQPGALTVTTYYRRIVNSGTCRSVSNHITITVQGTLSNTDINASQTICHNSSPAKLIGQEPTGGSGSFTYQWEASTISASNGFSNIIGATAADYQPVNLTQTTYFRRKVASGSCSAISNAVTITVIPQFNLAQVQNLILCNQATQNSITFTTDLNSANISFSWENNNPAIGLSASGTGILPAFTASNATKQPLLASISYKAIYTEVPLICEATPKAFNFTVLPTIAVTTVFNDQTLCTEQTTASVSLASDADPFVGSTVKYRWSSSVAIGLNNGEGLEIPSFTTINNGSNPINSEITVVPLYTYAGKTCEGTPKSYKITVNPAAKVDFSIPNQTICSNTTTSVVDLTSTTPNVDFAWIAQPVVGIVGLVNSGINQINTQTLVNTTNAPITIIYKAKATTKGVASCEGVETEYRITVNPIPTLTASETNKTICSSQNTNITLNSNVAATRYSWSVSANPNITGAVNGTGANINQNLVNSSATPQKIIYTVIPSFQNAMVTCNGDALEIEITVNPSPIVTFSTNDITICSGETSPATTLNSITPNAQITWAANVPSGITGLTTLTGTTTIPTETLVNTSNVPLTVVYTAVAKTDDANACAGSIVTYRVTVNPVARLTNSLLAQNVCSGGRTTAVVWQSNVAAATFSWTATASSNQLTGFTTSGNGNIPVQTLINSSTQVQKITYIVKPIAYGCEGPTATYQIEVYPSPIFTSSTQPIEICSGKTFLYTPTSSTTGVTFKWTRAAVPGISNAAASGIGIDAAGSISEALVNTTVNPIEVVYEYEMSINGCATGNKIPLVVKINPQTTANFGLSATNGCAPFNLLISNLNSRALVSTYTVDFGDGSPIETYADTRDITHTYENDTRLVKLFYLTITTRNECGESTSRPYEIRVQPQTVFSKLVLDATQTFGCAPFVVNFTAANQSTGANLYTWNFGDGSPIRQTRTVNENLIHTFMAAGTYTVTLTATNGCSTVSTTEQITVYPQVVADFSVNRPQNCVGAEFIFSNLSGAQFTSSWDFGDGTTSTEVNPKHSYATSGTKTITLRATQVYPNGGSCTAIITKTVNVLAAPNATFTTNAGALNCGPFALQAAATGSNVVNVEWDFGDGSSATGINVNHTYVLPGDYTITAKTYNAQGCTSTSSQLIRISESPIAAFNPSISEICGTSGSASFSNQTTYGGTDVVTYKWFVNGAFVSNQRDLTQNFVVPNGASLPYQFKIKLEASNMVACTTSEEKVLQFNPFPKAIFSVAQIKGCVPFKLNINNQSAYSDTFEWYVDGNLVATDRNPENIILTEFDKRYTLKLVVKNSYGCTQDEQILQVSTHPYLKAEFTLANDLSCNGILDVQITNNSTGATTYTWDYGDGTPAYVGSNPVHSYGRPGVYQLKLTASNGFCSDTYIKAVKIANAPRAAFLTDVSNGCNQLRVRFRNTSVNATSYYWDFGDGNFSREENPEHQYVFASTAYTVKLVASNAFGCTDETIASQAINVSPPPQATVEITPNKIIKVPEYTFTFKAISSEDIISYRWEFGDGSTSDRKDVTHKYDRFGTYQVKLHLTNRANCVNTIEDEVTIIDFPGYLYLPNAFEPENLNNDLKVFKVKASGLATYHLKIFNKWGQLIWQTNKLDQDGAPTEHWDGMNTGKLLPLGAYYWQAEATYINGGVWKGMKFGNKAESKTGVIHLIR